MTLEELEALIDRAANENTPSKELAAKILAFVEAEQRAGFAEMYGRSSSNKTLHF
jgi:hypothetical protein